MQIENLLNLIEKLLPRETAMEGDRLGLQIQSDNDEIRRFLITLEVNEKVVDEAKSLKSDCIVTFHPLIFHPLTSLVNDDRVGFLTKKIINSNISLISVHTNFDSFINGTSKLFAEKLNLNVVSTLVPDRNHQNSGMGVIAQPLKPISQKELLEKVNGICSSPVRFSTIEHSNKINKIAIVGGSGSSFIEDAMLAGCDAFITADLTYHQFHRVNRKMMLIDPGHYEMEQFVPNALAELLKQIMVPGTYDSMRVSKTLTNPVRYYPFTEKYFENQRQKLINN